MNAANVQKGCCRLLTLNRHGVSQWLKSFDTIVCDGDGVLWQQDRPLEGVADTFNALRAMGKRAFICSNNSTLSSKDIWTKARNMGLLIGENEVLTSANALANYLKEKEFKKKVFIMGEEGIAAELKAAGVQHLPLTEEVGWVPSMHDYVKGMELDAEVGAVVVGEDKNFNVRKLTKAVCYLANPKVLFLATNRDLAYPVGKGRYAPRAGVFVAATKMVAKRVPFICGKPNPYMCAKLMRQGLIKPERTLMVGDTLYTDIQFGYNCGFQTLLVGTGVSSLNDVQTAQASKQPHMYQQVPDLYVPKLADLLKFLPSKNC